MVRLVECSDHDVIYGYLDVKNVSIEDVQQKIYEIKNDEKFLQEHPDWTVEDVIAQFPQDWECVYYVCEGKILEI